MDSCGIVSQQVSVEKSEYHEDRVSSNECASDTEGVELPLSNESHGILLAKTKNEKIDYKDITYVPSRVLSNEAYLKQHEHNDTKNESG